MHGRLNEWKILKKFCHFENEFLKISKQFLKPHLFKWKFPLKKTIQINENDPKNVEVYYIHFFFISPFEIMMCMQIE